MKDHFPDIFSIFLRLASLTLEVTYARDSYYIVTIKRIVENSFWLYRSRCCRPASNLIRAAYTEPNVDIHSGVDFDFLFSLVHSTSR